MHAAVKTVWHMRRNAPHLPRHEVRTQTATLNDAMIIKADKRAWCEGKEG